MIAPNPRILEARRYAEELDAKRERLRQRDGKFETIGVPLTAEERDWLLVYVAAEKRMREVPNPKPIPWWRRQRKR